MHINKLIAINSLTNKLVYETDDDIIAKRNHLVYYVEFKPNNQLEVVSNDTRFELDDQDKSIIQLFVNSGFIQVNETTLVNVNFISQILIQSQLLELNNLMAIPYSTKFKHNIDNYLQSLND